MAGKIVQFDMFKTEKEQAMQLEMEEFKKMVVKSFRGLFARYNEIEFAMLEMHKRIDNLSESIYEKAEF
jgi:hypothetical protein